MPDLDSVSKRSSGINVGSPWRSSLPIPDGSLDQGDRQHVAHMYSGIAASGGVTTVISVMQNVVGPGYGDIYPCIAEVG